MIQIFCSNKLVEMIPEMLESYTGTVPELDEWCLNFTTVSHRIVVVAICADTRFGFILCGMRREHFEMLPELIYAGINKVFNYYGIRREITEDYLSEFPMIYAGVDRKNLGKLTRLTTDVSYMLSDEFPSEHLPLEYVSLINNMPVDVTKKNPYFPIDRMLERLEARYGMKPICRSAFEMTAVLDLGKWKATRTLLIPAEYTFEEFHQTMQTAFGWKECYDYAFELEGETIPQKDENDDKPPTNTWETTLSSKLEEGSKFTYLYSPRGGYRVSVQVNSIKADFDQPNPICLRCEGAVPPDDVGVVFDVAEFVEAYNDPKHPDHAEARKWAKPEWLSEPKIKLVNSTLRR